jgi:hypothetical protein
MQKFDAGEDDLSMVVDALAEWLEGKGSTIDVLAIDFDIAWFDTCTVFYRNRETPEMTGEIEF